MKRCDACGYQNDDDAQFCARCGASLEPMKLEEAEVTQKGCYGDETEDECFGLPHGGAICGILIGLFIIIWGLSAIFGFWNLIWQYWWPIVLIILGIFITAGACYGLNRNRR